MQVVPTSRTSRLRAPPWLAALLICCLWRVVSASSFTVSVDEHSGLPLVARGGATALSGEFVFWRENWVFADQETGFTVRGPFDYGLNASNQGVNLTLLGSVSRGRDRQLLWDLSFDAHAGVARAVGGGISFSFNLADFAAQLGEPELLTGNRGWSWGRPGSTRIEMRFEQPLAAIYFERDKKSEIRAFIYKDAIAPGVRHVRATLSVSADVALTPTLAERFGPVDYRAWTSDILAPDTAPVDLSFLNASERPAGKHGMLSTRGEKLVFEDGTAVRFWGTNLTAYALFNTPAAEVRKQARRISALGFNLVRLVHHDSEWVSPNVFGDQGAADTRVLNAQMLEKLDWWIKCLKDEGVYVWLDLHVGRRVKAGDGIRDFDEMRQGKASAAITGYNYVNDSIRDAMLRFNAEYLDHQNRFTGVRYKDEPAIAVLLITNENDLTNHFGNALLPDKGVPHHSAIYLREAGRFAGSNSLPPDQVWRAWEPGPSKLFLNDLEERFDVAMISHLRSIGARAPLVTTSTWGMNPLSSLPALTSGDIIDVHSYGGVGELEKDPQLSASLVDWMAAAQVAGKPLSVSEWGVDDRGSLAPDRHDIPLFVAGSAALQGWGAVLLFAYAQESLDPAQGTVSIYHAYNDPGLMATLPAAALLFRQGHVRESSTRYVFAPTEQLLFGQAISAANSVALRTAAARGRLTIALPQVRELPWLKAIPIPAGAQIMRDPRQSQLPPGSSQAAADSGELRRNWDLGTFTIDTPRTQAAMGWIGGRTITLPAVTMSVTTRNAAVAVQSLDGAPLGQARSLLISLGARALPASAKSLPYYAEPVEGALAIAAPAGLSLYVWDAAAAKARRQAVPFKDGRYLLTLDRKLASRWLTLQAQPAAKPARLH